MDHATIKKGGLMRVQRRVSRTTIWGFVLINIIMKYGVNRDGYMDT